MMQHETPELAVVVLCYRVEPGVVAAVASLLRQRPTPEIVVVSSGGGDARARLDRAGFAAVPVIERAERLHAGGARNLGIEATSARFVAFLAADCLAEDGWVQARLEAHRAGALAVSSAITNPDIERSAAWASHVYHFHRRMPGTPPHRVLHYGVSYARELFAAHGGFREDLRSGEDTELNRRLAEAGVGIAWAPAVRTAHRQPVTLTRLVLDEVRRGRRAMREHTNLQGVGLGVELVRTFGTVPRSAAGAWRAIGADERPRLLRALPWLVPAALARACGVIIGDRVTSADDPPRPREPRIIALIAFRDERRFLPGFLANVAPQVDGIVALDDGSTDGSGDIVAGHPAVLELLRRPPRSPHTWDEPGNRRLLVEAGRRHGADWLLGIDADERLERDFRRRALGEIQRLRWWPNPVMSVVIRELWGRPDRYRVDGIWGRKRRASFWKARDDHRFDTRALHGHWAPLNSLVRGRCPGGDLIVYHLRMIEAADRRARQRRYEVLDRERKWQAIGYDYLTVEAGCVLEALPAGREYEPLHGAIEDEPLHAAPSDEAEERHGGRTREGG